ncbi:MAG TPA: phosphatase [Lachnospiraceae bacterium]|nr:phosphatase [Lachnospiraceae bacterium]
MEYVVDAHCHTIISGHAYSTMREMARAAHEKGLLALGITEHGPKVPGCMINPYYIRNTRMIDRHMEGVELLLGVEADILNAEGELDVSEHDLSYCDIVIASIHKASYDHFDSRVIAENEVMRAYFAVLANPMVDIIGHPDDGAFAVDFDELAKEAKRTGKLLEVNNNSLDPRCSRLNGPENIRKLLAACRKYEVPVACNSDSHVDQLVGCHENSYRLFEEIGFPEELVVNASVDKLKQHLHKFRHP